MYQRKPPTAFQSDLARKLPSTWGYVDYIGHRYAVMLWRGHQDTGTGHYEIVAGYDAEQDATAHLQRIIAGFKTAR